MTAFTRQPGSYLQIEDDRLKHELDKDMSTIYKAHRELDGRSLKGPTDGFTANSGVTNVTGSATVASGIATVTQVIASIDNGAVATNLWVTSRINPADHSKIDLYVWKPTATNDNTPIAATGQVAVRWWVTGS